MSLILDALRKLERERDSREPGVLVVGSVPWGERSRASRALLVAGAGAVLALAVGLGWMLRPVPRAPAVVAPATVPATPPARPLLTPPPQLAPSLPAVAPPTTVPAPPPIRLSRPPALGTAAVGTPSSAPAAVRNAPAPVPATTGEATASAAARPAAADAVAETPAPAAAPASPPSTVELSSAPAPAPASAATDPAAPASAPAPAGLRLMAISQRDGRRVALINDRLVFEGDSFDGVRVLRIGEAEVEVEVKGQKQVLRF